MSEPVLAFTAAELAEHNDRVRADAMTADRMAIGAWIRALTGSGSLAGLARSIEHGDHIDDDAPPLPSLRMTLLLRDELLNQRGAMGGALRSIATLTGYEGDAEASPAAVIEMVAGAQRISAGRYQRINELHAEIDRVVPPHCQHAGDSGHDIGHGVHPDRGGPSVLEREIERLTAERDRLAADLEAERDGEVCGLLADLCDLLFDDEERAAIHAYDGVIERAREVLADRDRRIDPVEHARAVRDCFVACFAGALMEYGSPLPQARMLAGGLWLESAERAALLTRVGADVLAEVER